MTHGPAKRRDIARSVLPSTQRGTARHDLADLKRQARRAVRQDLRAIAAPAAAGDVVDEYDAAPFDPRRYPGADIRLAVDQRRGGDKLGPLIRWGRATTRHLPLEDRLPAVSRLFDDDLIGRHAISHLELDPHFRVDHPHTRWFDRFRYRPPAAPDPGELRAIAHAALEHGEHAELNRWMKRHPTDEGAVRLLAGAHDLDAFAHDCACTHAWQRALRRFAAT